MRLETYFEVGSLDLTWWLDLAWPWVEIFTKVAERTGGKVGENPAALRTAVFSLSSINLRGGGGFKRPLARGVRGAGEISAKFSKKWVAIIMSVWYIQSFCQKNSRNPLYVEINPRPLSRPFVISRFDALYLFTRPTIIHYAIQAN